ncbi:coiled-coil and C2 domain-containing protein 1-like isoform X2 [Anneissia japonica]|uniref:coiled-coil and C2 domain-containing protein 1-like isoform X2 n=1 Tax=Anneissia japonica TaxID=1529436 RepID=UPI0014256FB2|nr:coiled-coil and C2 domain-containing protein 1-like isoform X2 [Anneissia japonica]
MFKRKEKASTSRSSGKPTNELAAQLGLFDVPNIESLNAGIMQDDGNDEDLEAELAVLLGGDPSPKPKPKHQTKGGTSMMEIDSMVADVMNDKHLDESDTDDVENDEDLLAEFQELVADGGPSPAKQPSPDSAIAQATPSVEEEQFKTDVISIVAERLENYNAAIANAKANGEDSKVRRYTRGLEQVKAIDKKLKSGKTVDPADIPPPVIVGKPPPSKETAAPPPPKPVEEVRPPPSISVQPAPPEPSLGQASKPSIKSDSRYVQLSQRGDQYKQAAIEAKQKGDMDAAKEYLMISKQFQVVLKDFEETGDVDLTDMPPPPPGFGTAGVQSAATVEDVSNPKDAVEAMEQRLRKYKQSQESANAENNSGKSRRMGRIIKQYEDAIKKEKAGKPVDYEELPAPPGYPPIPQRRATKAAAPPQLKPRTVPTSPAAAPKAQPRQTSPALKPTVAKQLDVLEKRKKQFQIKALEAKKQGDMDEAKRLIKIAKGFDPLIEKSQGGFIVNMATIPDLPSVEDAVELAMECNEEVTGDRGEMFSRLQISLKKQIQTCDSNRRQFSQMGNINEVEKFEQMSRTSRQDLDTLVNAHAHGDPIPRFHYEYRTLPSLRVCPDLSENQAEIVIIRGVQLSPPSGYSAKDLDTYVKFEFPYPSDNTPSDKTHSKDGDNPEYGESFKLPINLTSRSFAGAVKRKSVKFEVFYKKGFLRSDGLLGTGSLKLTDFEKKCEIHESLQLMEGRKQVGGKLEVKVRIYRPLSGVKHDFTREKWLIIDGSSKISTQMLSTRNTSKGRTSQSSSICSAS